ncbi:MAG: hypothetical protein ACYCX0_12105 [Desulfurivibrionaceae bacterium]
MEMKVMIEIENGRQVFKVGDLPFDTQAEAQEFLDWMDWLNRRVKARSSDAEIWAGRRQASSDTPAIHDIATSLAYLSFVLAAVGAVDQLHLTMVRQLTSALEAAHRRQQGEGKDFAEKMERMRAAKPEKQQPPKSKNLTPGM